MRAPRPWYTPLSWLALFSLFIHSFKDTVVLNADATEAAIGTEGELACLNPFPSQPLFFWGDKDGKKYILLLP